MWLKKLSGFWAMLGCLAVWESYWLYAYITASVPDEKMAMPAAILFGGIIPAILLVAGLSGIWLFSRIIKQRW